MIAYNNNWLYNNYVRGQADQALHEQCISPEEHAAIIKAKEVGFYTPNYYVRFGLAFLTLVITGFTIGLLALMFGINSSYSYLFLFIGIVCYVVAEIFVNAKKHYNSGIDNMLVWMAAFLVSSGMAVNSSFSNQRDVFNCFLTCFVCFVLAVRFADACLSATAVIALAYCFIFYAVDNGSVVWKAMQPFIMILVFGVIYFFTDKAYKRPDLILYRRCFKWASVVALAIFYLAGNYYVVKEMRRNISDLIYFNNPPLPMGWFFWIWTMVVPFIYLAIGIRRKNITFIRLGVIFIAVSIFTFRYYHAILEREIAMIIAGVIVFSISYYLIKALRTPKNGFTFKLETFNADKLDFGKLLTNDVIGSSVPSHGPDTHHDNNWG
jgi:hypothetical protein